MQFFLNFILFWIGVFILIKGADFLVNGASSLAKLLKISPIVIGLTVVAFGTSAPELVVSLTSALNNQTDVTLGNIIGSNIANILLILGVSAIIYPLRVRENTVWKEIPMSFLGAILLIVLAFEELIDRGGLPETLSNSSQIIGSMSISNGIILLSFFVIFLYYTFGIAKAHAETEPEIEKNSKTVSIFLIILGFAGLVLGSNLLVSNGVSLARSIGVSDSFIGLTLIALGTSLPELTTSIVAALKKKADIVIGNVVGSNIFNIFLVLGSTTLVKPIPLPAIYIFDILFLFAATILLLGLLFIRERHVISRFEGSLMLTSYIFYISYLVLRG